MDPPALSTKPTSTRPHEEHAVLPATRPGQTCPTRRSGPTWQHPSGKCPKAGRNKRTRRAPYEVGRWKMGIPSLDTHQTLETGEKIKSLWARRPPSVPVCLKLVSVWICREGEEAGSTTSVCFATCRRHRLRQRRSQTLAARQVSPPPRAGIAPTSPAPAFARPRRTPKPPVRMGKAPGGFGSILAWAITGHGGQKKVVRSPNPHFFPKFW